MLVTFSLLRCLADSNRRRRFCRPVTKPLIQGTKTDFLNRSFNYFPKAIAKLSINSELPKLNQFFLS